MTNEEALATALEAFETCLETPIVPGELQAWTASARRTGNEAVTALQEHIPAWHEPVLTQINRQDMELAKRVEQLREEDNALLEEAAELQTAVNKLAADANSVASHDPAIKEAVSDLVRLGLAWIIRVRTQEAALTTWYQESFNRDRGVAD